MKRHIAHSLTALLFVSLLSPGCGPYHPDYVDIVGEEVLLPQGETDMIPQEGTTLSLNLSYELVPFTRFQKDYPYYFYQYYRFRVFINDWQYCYRLIHEEERHDLFQGDKTVSVPIMANDSHSPATVRVEASRCRDYEGTEWEEWHAIYSGIQEPLAETEELAFSGLEGKQLAIQIIDTEFTFDLVDSGPAMILKRLLKDSKYQLPAHVPYPYEDIQGYSDASDEYLTSSLKALVPQDDRDYEGKNKAGGLYLNNGVIRIALKNGRTDGIFIGSIAETELEDLLSFRQTHTMTNATMTLYLK